MARRRPSRAEEQAKRWVMRTPSGLPLCPMCHKELGFCPHSPIFRRDGSRSSGIAAMLGGASLAAVALQARERAVQGARQQMLPPPGGTKRRSIQENSEASRKGRRCEGSQDKAESAAASAELEADAADTELSCTERQPRTSARLAAHGTHASTTNAGKSGGEGGNGSKSDSGDGGREGEGEACAAASAASGGAVVTDNDEHLLRYPGFHRNDVGKECIGCYTAEKIMFSFGCEERQREGAASQAQEKSDEAEGDAQDPPTAADGSTTGADVSVSHVMCLDCFRVFVQSRVNERQLLAAREFDGYTVGCPMGCADSFVNPVCFEEILGAEFMVKYRRFSALHLASYMRIVWCPGCHCGVVPSAAAAAAAKAAATAAAAAAAAAGGAAASEAQQQAAASETPPRIIPLAPEISAPHYGLSLWGWWEWWNGADLPQLHPQPQLQLQPQPQPQPAVSPNNCTSCPGCHESLCLSCGALHAAEVDCADAHIDGGHIEDEDGVGGSRTVARNGARNDPSTGTKQCPQCHVPIFKEGGCNHMRCSMCQHEFCWLHLTEWVVGGPCQLGHWSSDPMLNRAYNAKQYASTSVREACTIS